MMLSVDGDLDVVAQKTGLSHSAPPVIEYLGFFLSSVADVHQTKSISYVT
jgi:hypothetical protein